LEINAALADQGIETIHIERPTSQLEGYPPNVVIARIHTPRSVRRAVRGKGYSPIPINGKKPDMLKGWQEKHQTNDAEIQLWDKMWPNATNTGILTKFTPAIDIDLMVPDAAEAIEQLAREWFGEHGDILVRFGQTPKRAILLRTDEPFRKFYQV